MFNLFMLLLIPEFFIYTTSIATHYVLCQQKANWSLAQNLCVLPSLTHPTLYKDGSMLDHKVLTIEHVWTSEDSVVSDWAKFYGCFDIKIERNDDSRLKELFTKTFFLDDIEPLKSVSLQYCAFYCTGRANYFVHYMNMCKCLKDVEQYQYEVDSDTYCLQSCTNAHKNNVVFCSSADGLPVFTFVKDEEENVIRVQESYQMAEQCLTEFMGRHVVSQCNSTNSFLCRHRRSELNEGSWRLAVNVCLNSKALLRTNRHSKQKLWLDYFMLLGARKDKRNHKCVSMSIVSDIDNTRTLTFQYRNCSDALRVMCLVKGSSPSSIVGTDSATTCIARDTYPTRKSGNDTETDDVKEAKDSCLTIIVTASTSLLVVIVVLIGIILNLRSKLYQAIHRVLNVGREDDMNSDVSSTERYIPLESVENRSQRYMNVTILPQHNREARRIMTTVHGQIANDSEIQQLNE